METASRLVTRRATRSISCGIRTENRVLRAALATADATAYDRLDLILRMLVEEKEEDEPRVALSPVDENTSNQVAKVSDAEKRRRLCCERASSTLKSRASRGRVRRSSR